MVLTIFMCRQKFPSFPPSKTSLQKHLKMCFSNSFLFANIENKKKFFCDKTVCEQKVSSLTISFNKYSIQCYIYTHMCAIYKNRAPQMTYSAIANCFGNSFVIFSFTTFSKHYRAADGGKPAVIKVRNIARNHEHDLFYFLRNLHIPR